ncbi:MAG TPA: rhomboid family intramembrane serine protease, partial [Candidatus Polarisedimenticolia bacterium]|nr:rhomboid family intramembrane serine protease [Candidatus Polarisedimenticolia bacterium]
MIPLRDDNPTRTVPLITIALVAINAGLFVWEMLLPGPRQAALLARLSIVPAAIAHASPLDPPALLHQVATLFTAMFLHGSLLHVAGNMLYLWIFGNNIEDVMGHARFLAFYLICGLTGSLAQVAASPASTVPLLGASGAIAGVLGAYLVMFPAARVETLIFLFVFARVVPIPAVIVLGVWLLIQIVNAGRVAPGGVAWFAHLGGFGAGLALLPLFRR